MGRLRIAQRIKAAGMRAKAIVSMDLLANFTIQPITRNAEAVSLKNWIGRSGDIIGDLGGMKVVGCGGLDRLSKTTRIDSGRAPEMPDKESLYRRA